MLLLVLYFHDVPLVLSTFPYSTAMQKWFILLQDFYFVIKNDIEIVTVYSGVFKVSKCISLTKL